MRKLIRPLMTFVALASTLTMVACSNSIHANQDKIANAVIVSPDTDSPFVVEPDATSSAYDLAPEHLFVDVLSDLEGLDFYKIQQGSSNNVVNYQAVNGHTLKVVTIDGSRIAYHSLNGDIQGIYSEVYFYGNNELSKFDAPYIPPFQNLADTMNVDVNILLYQFAELALSDGGIWAALLNFVVSLGL